MSTFLLIRVPFIVEGILTPIVSTIGLLGNILSIIIFYNSHDGNSPHSNFKKLLICLAVFDSLFLISNNIIFTTHRWLLDSSPIIPVIPYLLPLANIFLTCSVYTVVAITVERFATIRQSHSGIFSARALIFFVLFISVSYNFIKFFELTTEEANYLVWEDGVAMNETFEPYIEIERTWLGRHPTYIFVYHFLINLIVMTLIPIIVLIVLNVFILQSIKKRIVTRSDSAMTTLLFSIVIVLLICHTPRAILSIGGVGLDEGPQEDPEWEVTMDTMFYLNHLLLLLNPFLVTLSSSVNIIIYTVGDPEFRQALVRKFQCKRRSPTTKNIPLHDQ